MHAQHCARVPLHGDCQRLFWKKKHPFQKKKDEMRSPISLIIIIINIETTTSNNNIYIVVIFLNREYNPSFFGRLVAHDAGDFVVGWCWWWCCCCYKAPPFFFSYFALVAVIGYKYFFFCIPINLGHALMSFIILCFWLARKKIKKNRSPSFFFQCLLKNHFLAF